jgi:molecular chaperone DnaJ
MENMDVPAGTQHGEVFKLKSRGLPDVRSHRAGDQLVQIVIEVPKKLNDRQKQLLREFAASEDARLQQQRGGFFDKLKDLIKGEDSKS